MGAIPNSAHELLLVLYSGITPGGLERPNGVLRIEPREDTLKCVYDVHTVHAVL